MDTILTDIARHGIVLTPSSGPNMTPNAPDPGDQFLWELLNTRADLELVTGDKLLLADLAMQQRVILPQAFIAQLTH